MDVPNESRKRDCAALMADSHYAKHPIVPKPPFRGITVLLYVSMPRRDVELKLIDVDCSMVVESDAELISVPSPLFLVPITAFQ